MTDPVEQQQADTWFTVTSGDAGNPLIFRARERAPAGVNEADYSTLVSIYWPYEPANESGMPDSETEEAQVELEDALDELDKPGMSILMLVVTGNGQKEWHWYVSDRDAWEARLNELLENRPVFPIQLEAREEPDWALYRDFISGVKGL
jgi:hypothetical protein